MMPLTLAAISEENMIKKIGGKPEVKNILKILHFCRKSGSNLIVNVKEIPHV